MEIGQSAGKSFAYLLGVYLGDGCVTKPSPRSAAHRRCFKLNTIDRDFADAVVMALADIGFTASVSTHTVKRSSKPNHSVYSGCDDLCRVLVEDTNHKASIPAYVKGWPAHNRLAFVAGLMDSEGFVAENGGNPTNRRYYMGFKSCDAWVPEFIDILQSLGIRVGKVSQETPRKPGYKVPTRFTVKMQSWIDSGARFNIARKQNRVDAWASVGAYESRTVYPRRLTSETTRQTPERVMI